MTQLFQQQQQKKDRLKLKIQTLHRLIKVVIFLTRSAIYRQYYFDSVLWEMHYVSKSTLMVHYSVKVPVELIRRMVTKPTRYCCCYCLLQICLWLI